MDFEDRKDIRFLSVDDRWCVHSYYTICPYAPDRSGRILAAGADLKENTGEVLILSPEGKVLDRFGLHPLNNAFYHTGWWQTWSADAKFVYYQSGSLYQPEITKREISTGKEKSLDGEMEGVPPSGEPIISGLMGMLYAAGYGDGKTYSPELSPVPFQKRDEHGLFEYNIASRKQELRLSVAEMLERHPQWDRILKEDMAIKKRLGNHEGLTLMLYCVRWNQEGSRFLFYFGNHCTIEQRGEPRLGWVFTTDRCMRDMHLVLDLSFDRFGEHWAWHPDNERLIGYGPDPDNPSIRCLAEVHHDGIGYHRISRHDSRGHPSVSPMDYRLLVTDTYGIQGEVTFIDLRTDTKVKSYSLSRAYEKKLISGRHSKVLDHHPVFHPDGTKVLINTLFGVHGTLAEIQAPIL